MTTSLDKLKTGQVTYAVRDAKANGFSIKEGDIMGIFDNEIVCHDKELMDTSMQLLEKMVDEDDGIITIFYGEDADENEVKSLAEKAEEQFPDCDVEVHNGVQPVYTYVFSVE